MILIAKAIIVCIITLVVGTACAFIAAVVIAHDQEEVRERRARREAELAALEAAARPVVGRRAA